MITCLKCGKEIHFVNEIGEIIRSYDGNDMCLCPECSKDFKEGNLYYNELFSDSESVYSAKQA